MPYVTSIERLGIERGRQEGMQSGRVAAAREAVEEAVRIRFGPAPDPVAEALAEASDLDVLREWLRLAITAPSLAVLVEGIAPEGERSAKH